MSNKSNPLFCKVFRNVSVVLTFVVAASCWFQSKLVDRPDPDTGITHPVVEVAVEANIDLERPIVAINETEVTSVSEEEVAPAVSSETKKAPVLANKPGVSEEEGAKTDDTSSEFEIYKVVATKQTSPDESGRFQRIQVLETNFKYPLIRMEEEVKLESGTSEEKILYEAKMVADHLMVKLEKEANLSALNNVIGQYGAEIRKQLLTKGVYLVSFDGSDPENFDRLSRLMNEQKDVILHAEPDLIVSASALTPNDPSFPNLQGLHNTGQNNGTVDADIDAPEAWDIATGSQSILVGVIDSGVDYTHPDLAPNIWSNPNEIPANGVDDDGNGLIDDIRGWDFASNDDDPMDFWNSHGTHVAGTIGAVGNNGIGVVGVNWNVTIVPIRLLGNGGFGVESDAVDCISYATQIGVDLTSNSWGASGYSQILYDVVEQAGFNGIALIAAAMNESSNTDQTANTRYPAAFYFDHVISVAATTRDDGLAGFSNYGLTSVDLGAPGAGILSTMMNGEYGYMDGTSMATPHVSGAYALIKSISPNLSVGAIKHIILRSGDPVPALEGKTVTGGRLNLYNSVLKGAEFSSETGAIVVQQSEVLNDAAGNGDGDLNPGESIRMFPAIENVGSEIAYGVTVSVSTQSPYVTFTGSTSTVVGDVHTGTILELLPFDFQIASNVPTPSQIEFVVSIQDSSSNTWTSRVVKNVYTSTVISGKSLRIGDGSSVPGANIYYYGPRSGNTVTAADGSYSLSLVDGTYTLHSFANGFVDVSPQEVTVPPDATNVNFLFGIAELTTSVNTLTANLSTNENVSLNFAIGNAGDADLQYQVTQGNQYDYLWSDSRQAGGPVYQWQEISGTGARLNDVSTITGTSDEVHLSFPFPFYQNTYGSVFVCTDGYVMFGASSIWETNGPLPGTYPHNQIAAFHDELDLARGGDVYFQGFGTHAIIQYEQAALMNGSGHCTFQVVLYPSGLIRVYYKSMTGTLNSATVGIQNIDGTVGIQAAYNEAYVGDNFAVEFSPLPFWVSLPSTGGLVTPGGTQNFTVNIDSAGLAAGLYERTLLVQSLGPDLGEELVTVSLSVGSVGDGRIELETLTRASSSSDGYNQSSSNGNASGGAFTWFGSNEVGDYITFDINIPTVGNYQIFTGVGPSPTSGTFQLKVNGADAGVPQDLYSANYSFEERDLGIHHFGLGGNKSFRFEIIGTNGSNSIMRLDYIRLDFIGNRDPVLADIPDFTLLENGPDGTAILSAIDPDGDPITFSVSTIPFGKTITDNGDGTGSIVLNPWYAGSGVYDITVTASDDQGGSDSKMFTVTVIDVNRNPTLAPIPNFTLLENGPDGTAVLSASDPDGDAIMFDVSLIPFGKTITDNGDGTGSIVLDPWYSGSGVHPITVTANDGRGGSVGQTFTVIVNNVNRAPTVAGIPDQAFEAVGSATVLVQATDPDTDDTLTLSTSNLPAFGSLTDNGDGTGVIDFDLDSAALGEYLNIIVAVNDGNQTDNTHSVSFKLTVIAATQTVAYTNDFSDGSPSDDFTGNNTAFFSIAGGEMVVNDPSLYKTMFLNTTDVPEETDNFKIVSRMKKGSASGYKGSALRFRHAASTDFSELQIRSHSGDDIRIRNRAGGNWSSVGSWDMDMDPEIYHVYSILVSGTNVNVYLGNNHVGSAVIGSATGRVGLSERQDHSFWDYYRVVSFGEPDYVQGFDNSVNHAQGWNYNGTEFEFLDTGSGNFVLKQSAGTSYDICSYNKVVSVDANYSVSVEARVTGTRIKHWDSPNLVVRYKDANNFFTMSVRQETDTGVRSIVLKKLIGGISNQVSLVSGITSVEDVANWHSLEAQVNGDKISIWINGVEEVTDYVDADLMDPVFDSETQCGVRSPTANVSAEFDNFKFYDEYE